MSDQNKSAGFAGFAFPTPDVLHPNDQIQYGTNGMTLRDYFAAVAVQGDLASEHEGFVCKGNETMTRPQILAKLAYEIADAMIAERSK